MSARYYALLLAASLVVVSLTFGALEWRFASADDPLPALVDAGPAPASDAPAAAEPPDPIASPSESLDLGKTMWQRGGWQFAVVLAWVLCAAWYKRMTPADKDGDGKPDVIGWRGKSWALSFGLLAVLGPAAAVAMGADGAAWSAVPLGLPVLMAAIVDAVNPVRGAKAKAV